MKKIIKGKMFDTESAISVCHRTISMKVPVIGYNIEAKVDIRLELYRKVVAKPNYTLEEAYNAGAFYPWREEKIDLHKGEFFLVASTSYSAYTARVMTDEEAQEFMDSCDCPEETWTKYFGTDSDDTSAFVDLKKQLQSKDWTIENSQKEIESKNARIKELEDQLNATRLLIAGASNNGSQAD